eukprot:TRINITY_DN42673_c0_g1_i11.p2 TRINITY_DN42673_c0_g1~~TRINITY_DN42673_c0_g1_i11.p2  ORF type:complete len:108 (-),score=1.85 TRINITY_DN42673_c0_g1_i11:240-563(-)
MVQSSVVSRSDPPVIGFLACAKALDAKSNVLVTCDHCQPQQINLCKYLITFCKYVCVHFILKHPKNSLAYSCRSRHTAFQYHVTVQCTPYTATAIMQMTVNCMLTMS